MWSSVSVIIVSDVCAHILLSDAPDQYSPLSNNAVTDQQYLVDVLHTIDLYSLSDIHYHVFL